MFSRFIIFSLILFHTFTQCNVQVSKDRIKALISTLKRLMTTAETEKGAFGAQLDICQAEFAKIEFINEQLIKESAGLTRTSFNLIRTKKTDKTGSTDEKESQKILLPYYMKLQELLAQIDQRLRMGLDCVDKMAQIHKDRIKAAYLGNDEEAYFATVESDIDHIKAEMLEILSNAQLQRDLYRLNSGKSIFRQG